MNSSDPRIYVASRIYRLLTLVGLAVALLFVWTLTQLFDLISFAFFLAAILFALMNVRWLLTRVELTPSGITRHDPISAPQHVDFRQMVTVSEAGRITPGVSIVYYPVAESGLVDMEEPRSIFLPAMEKQDELLAILHHEMLE
jgi:uncharacterized protein (DUF58 family)